MDTAKLKKDLDKVVVRFEEVLSKIQTGKASTGVIEDLDVYIPSWGQTQKVQGLAQISLLDPQTIKIESWDKSVLSHIEKAIYDSNLGFTPVNQWDWIMIKIPPMTEERRKELAKLVDKMWEDTKIAIRNIRHDRRNKIKELFEENSLINFNDEEVEYLKKNNRSYYFLAIKLSDVGNYFHFYINVH